MPLPKASGDYRSMNLRSAKISVNNRILILTELQVLTYEALITGYTPQQLANGHGGRLQRELLCHAIVSVDGAPPIESALRSIFPLARHWASINAAYVRLVDADSMMGQLNGITPESNSATITLSGGTVVVLRSLTADEDESIDIREHRGRHQVSALHSKIVAALVSIDGRTVDPTICDPRLEIPRAADWQLMAGAFQILNQPVDIPDFLPETPE